MNSQKIDVYLGVGGVFPAGLDMAMMILFSRSVGIDDVNNYYK